MICHSRMLAAVVLISLHVGLASAETGEWPQFLGPDRNGISTERNLLESWPAGGPKQVWRVKGGVGMSGLAIGRGRLLTLVQTEGQQRLVALDAQTGQPIWQTPIAPAYSNPMGDGPRATPTISGERVFTFSGQGVLACVSFGDGRVLWSHNLLEERDGKLADYGMACSPLVVDEHVIVTLGVPNASVMALDAATGKVAWSAGSDPAGYSSPAVLNVGGNRQIVAFTGNSLLGLAPSSGAVLWRYPYVTDFNCNIATPLAIDGKVFISSGENHGSVLLALKSTGNRYDVSEVWASQGAKSVLRNEWQTSILLDGHLYGFDNVGGAGPVSHLTCVRAADGQRVWQQLRFGKGNLIAADGKLFISTINGELVIVRATPKGYDELGRATILGATRQTPALAGGLLYLRDNEEIVCLDVRKQ
jgi:outer membrane protein assembly factor BamB